MKFRPPIDIHEATIEPFQVRDRDGRLAADVNVDRVISAVREARIGSEALAALAETLTNDKLISPEARALRLRDNALKVAESAAKRLDAAKASIQTEVEALDSRIAVPPLPKDSVAAGIEAEIRARLASMGDDDRGKVIDKAFEAKDLSLIAAVLRGPAMLVGMSQARHDMVRMKYRTTWHADEYVRLSRLSGAMDAMERSGKSFVGFIAKMTSNPTVALAEAAAKNTEDAERAVLAHTQE